MATGSVYRVDTVRVETISVCAYSLSDLHNVNSMCEVGEVSVLGPDLGVAD